MLIQTNIPYYFSDEETGGPGGKALAQLTVLLFIAALNNQSAPESDTTNTPKKLGSKRSIEWDLNTPGFRYPPLKKIAFHDGEFDSMFVAPDISKYLYYKSLII